MYYLSNGQTYSSISCNKVSQPFRGLLLLRTYTNLYSTLLNLNGHQVTCGAGLV
jgi:hypothetical protein